jgi:hypothetical protein
VFLKHSRVQLETSRSVDDSNKRPVLRPLAISTQSLTHSVGGTQKGDSVKELMQTAFDLGINMFDVSVFCFLRCFATGSNVCGPGPGPMQHKHGWEVCVELAFYAWRRHKQNEWDGADGQRGTISIPPE